MIFLLFGWEGRWCFRFLFIGNPTWAMFRCVVVCVYLFFLLFSPFIPQHMSCFFFVFHLAV